MVFIDLLLFFFRRCGLTTADETDHHFHKLKYDEQDYEQDDQENTKNIKVITFDDGELILNIP